MPLSTQVYEWVPANLMLGGNPAVDWHPIQGGGGGAEILVVASCYRNRDKLRPDEPLGSYADFTLRFSWPSRSLTTESNLQEWMKGKRESFMQTIPKVIPYSYF